MFAEVYPLKRLPRRFRAFDYAVPEGMAVRRGSFVRIPLRGSSSVGLVAKVKETAEAGFKVKPIEAMLDVSLSAREMDAYERLAEDLVQSPSSLLHAVLPLPPKRAGAAVSKPPLSPLKIRSEDADAVTEAVRFAKSHPACFVRAPDLRFAAAVIAGVRRTGGAVRVAAPNVRDAELLHGALGGGLLTGSETNNARHAAWSAFRSAKDGLLIGTRLVSLLEHPDGSTLFVVRSGHENLHQADRNPRYDARLVARRWAELGSRVVFLDVLPRAGDLRSFPSIQCPPIEPMPEVVEMKGRETWTHPYLSPAVIERLEAAMADGGRVLLAFNRKGVARKHGIESIAMQVQGLFPDRSVRVCEKDAPSTDAQVVVATRHYLENAFDPFKPEPFALVADLDADAAFADKTFRATEQALRTAAEWHAVARAARAPLLLQTATPELFRHAFADPLAVLSEDLESRRAYGYPPFVKMILVDGVETPLPDGIIPESLRNAPDSVIIDTSAFS
jgi:primosomal protein N'